MGFFEDYGVADVKFIEMVKKKIVLFDKEDFGNHCAVISIQNYIEIYFESCETCCAPIKRKQKVSCLFTVRNKNKKKQRAGCETTADIVQKKKKLNRISFIPPYF